MKRLLAAGLVVGMFSVLGLVSVDVQADEFRSVPLTSAVTDVQPMTGIVLWSSNPEVRTAPIQLEFSYLTYRQIVTAPGTYDWSPVERLLDEISARGHQAVLRWHDTYVGKPSGIPDYIQALPGYRGMTAASEKQPTGFPDWAQPELQSFLLEFFERFASRYDRDPRIAFVQVGFGLWSEYHIYDGPMIEGQTFPDREYQAKFLRHLSRQFRDTPWMISVDAAGSHTPLATDESLRQLKFGLFDDSFNHARHARENEPNWNLFGRDRWQTSPMGGEFSFFQSKDQKLALAPRGPHGIPFEQQAARFHVSFIIGDDQPRFQKAARLREAGLACGYQFAVTQFEASDQKSRVVIENRGIAPFYYDAFPTVNGVRSATSLKGLLPGESRTCVISAGGPAPQLTITSDRLVAGQKIGYAASLR